MTGATAHPKLREKQECMNSEKRSVFTEYAAPKASHFNLRNFTLDTRYN